MAAAPGYEEAQQTLRAVLAPFYPAEGPFLELAQQQVAQNWLGLVPIMADARGAQLPKLRLHIGDYANIRLLDDECVSKFDIFVEGERSDMRNSVMVTSFLLRTDEGWRISSSKFSMVNLIIGAMN